MASKIIQSDSHNIPVIKLLSDSQLNISTSQEWNNNGQVYKKLLHALSIDQGYDLYEETIPDKETHVQLKYLNNFINKCKNIKQDPDIWIIDFAKYHLAINILDAIMPIIINLTECSRLGTIIIIPIYYISMAKNCLAVENSQNRLKNSKKGLAFIEPNSKLFVVNDFPDNKLPRSLQAIESIEKYGAPPNREQFAREIIYNSERWFGHFILPSEAHVRTHYDCYYLIMSNNWLFRYAKDEGKRLISETKPDVLVGFGLATNMIAYFSNSLAAESSLRSIMITPGSKEYQELLNNSDRVLLVSDVVLTGNTASRITAELEDRGNTVIGLLTMVSLKNSVQFLRTKSGNFRIISLGHIGRPFYHETDCPLCLSNYPKTVVNDLKDFRVLPKYINAYDFWEAVDETNALCIEHKILHNRHYTYYIDITKLATLYKKAIVRQLNHQLESIISVAKPYAIVYPESPGAAIIANAMAKELNIKDEYVVSLPREFLKSLASISDFTNSLSEGIIALLREKHVLVIDDGCNSYTTISQIKNFLERIKSDILAYAVVLNRANKDLNDRKRKEIAVSYFYHWPVAPYEKELGCPECAKELNNGTN